MIRDYWKQEWIDCEPWFGGVRMRVNNYDNQWLRQVIGLDIEFCQSGMCRDLGILGIWICADEINVELLSCSLCPRRWWWWQW